jgi:hypothetical protein
VLGATRPRTRSRHLPWIAKPGRREIAFATAAATRGPRRQKSPHRSRAGGVLSLDWESLMGVRSNIYAVPFPGPRITPYSI